MQFNLPDNLKQSIRSYDPTLKKQPAPKRERTGDDTPRRKVEFPVGNVCDLIPTHIVPAEQQAAAVRYMNASEAPQRWRSFTRPSTPAEKEAGMDSQVTQAIQYYHDGWWVASWLPGPDDDYIYGISFATRVNSRLEARLAWFTEAAGPDHFVFEEVKYGRSTFKVARKLVTMHDINASSRWQKYMWDLKEARGYRKSTQGLAHQCIQPFFHSLKSKWKNWEDGDYNFLADLTEKSNSILHIIVVERMEELNALHVLHPCKYSDQYANKREEQIIKLSQQFDYSADSFLAILGSNTYALKNAVAVLNKPFFRSWLTKQGAEMKRVYEDRSNKYRRNIRRYWSEIKHIASWIEHTLTVWPDTPFDYFRNNLDMMMDFGQYWTFRALTRSGSSERLEPTVTALWLREHMPVSSFFQILNKHRDECVSKLKEQGTLEKSYQLRMQANSGMRGLELQHSTLFDTFNMIRTLLDAKQPFDVPKRWRVEEFHDYICGEAWKVKHKNESLPQDLFPQPIKLEHEGEKWCLLQPIDTHQLAQWGTAVRNCVGNATNYAEGVRKKNHFIVLAMVDSKPRFTIQLKVNDGVMAVEQVVDVGNASLNQEQKDVYTKVFAQALEIRDKQLKEGVTA